MNNEFPFRAAEQPGQYIATRAFDSEELLTMANRLVSRRFAKGRKISKPADVLSFLKCKLAHLEHEVFSIIFLDTKHNILAFKEMFRGTIHSTSIYPREIIKEALKYNAQAIILVHNHPSGCSEPSSADINVTHKIKNILAELDIDVLDHIIVAGIQTVSLAERGVL